MNKIFACLVLMGAGIGAMESPSHLRKLSLKLLEAADKGETQRIIRLLKKGADPATQDEKEKNTPLILATLKRHHAAVDALLPSMTPPMVNITNAEGVPALLHATANGDKDTVHKLIGAGADVNYTLDLSAVPNIPANQSIYPTALMIALFNAYAHCAQRLLLAGANPNIEDRNRVTALSVAAQIGTTPEVMQLLLKQGADVSKKDKQGKTALYYLVTSGECEYTSDNIEAMVKAGGNINELFEAKNNVLQLAFARAISAYERAKKENDTYADPLWPSNYLVGTLIKFGINVRHRNDEGKTALDLVRPYRDEFTNKYSIELLEKAEKEIVNP